MTNEELQNIVDKLTPNREKVFEAECNKLYNDVTFSGLTFSLKRIIIEAIGFNIMSLSPTSKLFNSKDNLRVNKLLEALEQDKLAMLYTSKAMQIYLTRYGEDFDKVAKFIETHRKELEQNDPDPSEGQDESLGRPSNTN